MPKRLSSRTVKSDEVQGEGSEVTLTGLKVYEMKEQRLAAEEAKNKATAYNKQLRKHKKLQEANPDLDDLDPYTTKYNVMDAGIETLKKHILAWNWVDDDGEPLPQPQEDSDVFDKLTDDEVAFLIDHMMGIEEVKN